MLAGNLPWTARDELQVRPAIELRKQRFVAVAVQILSVHDQVSRTALLDRVHGRRLRKVLNRLPEPQVRRRKESAVAIDQRLPMEGRVIEIGRIVGRSRRELEQNGGRTVCAVAQEIGV